LKHSYISTDLNFKLCSLLLHIRINRSSRVGYIHCRSSDHIFALRKDLFSLKMSGNFVNSSVWESSYTDKGTINYEHLRFLKNPWIKSWEFENFESVKPVFDYMQLNKATPLVFANIYVLGAFGLQHWMKSKAALELKWPLFSWNVFIGIFSIVGFLRTSPDLIYVLSQQDGFYKSMCLS